MSGAAETSGVVLRALRGEPLRDGRLRDIVVATAHAIAERNGVELVELAAAPDHIAATLRTNRLAALGFAVELRRLTTAWYRQKYGEETLWGEPRGRDEPDDDPYGLFEDGPD
jgi:hypothetical protein